MEVKRGDVWLAHMGHSDGAEQNGLRPVVVIQNDIGNGHAPITIVASLTSVPKRHQATHVKVNRDEWNGLDCDSTIMLEQIRTIDKKKLIAFKGRLGKSEIESLNRALAISVGLVK